MKKHKQDKHPSRRGWWSTT